MRGTLVIYTAPGKAGRRVELSALRLLGLGLGALGVLMGLVMAGWQLGQLIALGGY